MHSELTNLLPLERQRALSRDYVLRLIAAAAVLLTILAAVAAVLLLPTYVLLTQHIATSETHLANIKSILSSSNEAALSSHLTTLSNDAEVLTALQKAPSASATLRKALSIPHPGIALSGFSYVPTKGPAFPGTLAISGSASTRDALRAYQLALQSDPFASIADLPVSAYAKDANIPFTITVTLSP